MLNTQNVPWSNTFQINVLYISVQLFFSLFLNLDNNQLKQHCIWHFDWHKTFHFVLYRTVCFWCSMMYISKFAMKEYQKWGKRLSRFDENSIYWKMSAAWKLIWHLTPSLNISLFSQNWLLCNKGIKEGRRGLSYLKLAVSWAMR